MNKLNPKKDKLARRKRPFKSASTHKLVYIEEKRKSRAGVEYVHYKPMLQSV